MEMTTMLNDETDSYKEYKINMEWTPGSSLEERCSRYSLTDLIGL